MASCVNTDPYALTVCVYISPAENPQDVLPGVLDAQVRLEFIGRHGLYPDGVMSRIRRNIVGEPVMGYSKVNGGDVFSLGGRNLLAVSLHGHSIGGICHVDHANGMAFTGGASDWHKL